MRRIVECTVLTAALVSGAGVPSQAADVPTLTRSAAIQQGTSLAAKLNPEQAARLKPLLSRGTRSPAVVFVQRRLGVTPASGYYGKLTEAAVTALQKERGLKQTGRVGTATWKVLLKGTGVIAKPQDTSAATPAATSPTPAEAAKARPVLKPGAGPGNPAVVFVQQYLHVTPATGYFGARTKAAVRAYQRGLGIRATGNVGPLTWAAIAAGRVATPTQPTPAARTEPANTSRGGTESPRSGATGSGSARAALAYALAQVGKSYVLGGNGPDAFDCSGLVQQAYLKVGIRLPRTAAKQRFAGEQIGIEQIRPGDLLYYEDGSKRRPHIALYAGNGQAVEAANPRRGVRLRDLNMKWYRDRFVTAVRVG
ncbi:MAG: peptidoglycan-binding protein [Candidatus Nanopelagicales bacterium]